MGYQIELGSLAALETIEAYDWYEQQRKGLGDEFIKELENFFSILIRNPNTYSYYDKPVRQEK